MGPAAVSHTRRLPAGYFGSWRNDPAPARLQALRVVSGLLAPRRRLVQVIIRQQGSGPGLEGVNRARQVSPATLAHTAD